MLTFGMPTLIETESLEDCAALCSRLGLKFIEINMNFPQYQCGSICTSYCRELAGKHGIFYTIHLDEHLCVTDFNPYVAQAYRRTVCDTIALAKELCAPVINMHLAPGIYITLPDRKVWLFDVYRERYLADILTFREECEREIGDCGIKICIENCAGFTPLQLEAIDLMLESDCFALTFDIEHDHAALGADKGHILARKERLAHMHMHDAKGTKNHLTLGTGELELDYYLALSKRHGCRVVLETKAVEALEQSVQYLTERGEL